MTKLYSISSQTIIRDLTMAKQRIAEGHKDSAQNWIDSALATLMRAVVQDVEAETIPAPTTPADQVPA
jgi:hypothetical protein